MENIDSFQVHESKLDYNPEDVNFLSTKIDEIDKHLQSLIKNKKLYSAGYLISRDNKIFAHRSMGRLLYNIEKEDFMPDSIRRVASVTKLFVAVSILQLVEKGKIWLDQSVSEIISEFKNPMYEKISIKHLLTHTSGIRPDSGIFFEPYPREGWMGEKEWIKESLRDFAAICPGKEWRYSSTGFTILAEVVTRVSGIHFEKYVVENILKPLDMKDSFFDVPDEAIPNMFCI